MTAPAADDRRVHDLPTLDALGRRLLPDDEADKSGDPGDPGDLPGGPWYLVELLEELHATANRVRAGLARATRDYSYGEIAEATGLSIGTIQRWRIEHPTAAVLRAADVRRQTNTAEPGGNVDA